MLGSKDPQARHLDFAVLVRLCGSVIEYARMSSININHCSNSWLQQLADNNSKERQTSYNFFPSWISTKVWVRVGFYLLAEI